MKRLLQARRQRIVRELAQLNREIAVIEQRLAEIRIRLEFLGQVKIKAAA